MELQNIDFSYEPKEGLLIRNLSMKVCKGMFLTVVGENGSAKSTLIKLMLNILKPQKGNIKNEFKTTGYVPQKKSIYNSSFPITVYEMMKIHAKTSNNTNRDIDEVLKLVSMEKFKGRLFGSLSGGQMQRVLIARAVLSNPDLLILDEPLTGIDTKSQVELKEILRKLHDSGVTIVAIEHDIAFALHNSTHIMTMKEGQGKLYTSSDYRKKLGHEDWDNYIYHKEECHTC